MLEVRNLSTQNREQVKIAENVKFMEHVIDHENEQPKSKGSIVNIK